MYCILCLFLLFFLELLEEVADVRVVSKASSELFVVNKVTLVGINLEEDLVDDLVDGVEVLRADDDAVHRDVLAGGVEVLEGDALLDNRDEHILDLILGKPLVPVLVEEREGGLELLLGGPKVGDAHHHEVLVGVEGPAVVRIEGAEHVGRGGLV